MPYLKSNGFEKLYFHFFITLVFILKLLESVVSFVPNLYVYYVPIVLILCFYRFILVEKVFSSSTPLIIFLITTATYFVIFLNVILSQSVDNKSANSLDFHLLILLLIPSYFFYGFLISKFYEHGGKISFFEYIILAFLVFFVLIFTDFKYYRLDFSIFKYDKAVYLLLGDLLAFTGIYYFTKESRRLYKFFYAALFTVLLFFVYSRTGLYFFIAVIFLNVMIKVSFRTKLLLSSLLIALFYALFTFQASLAEADVSYSLSRMLFIFFDSKSDGSLNGRELIFLQSLKSMFDNLYVGDFANQVELFGGWSFYIHNILSYLRQFGVFVFLSIVVSLLFIMIKFLFKSIEEKKFFGFYDFLFCITLYIVLIFIFSRSYNYPYIYMVFGFYLGGKLNESVTDR